MAQALKHLCALALAVLCGAALAQDGIDPTRPPAVMTAPPAVAGAAPLPLERAEPQLQSILVSLRPGGRRIAVIDGKIVRQGQRVGDAVLVAIGSTEVVLRRAGKTQTLKLFRPASRVATVQP
jgi:MSHA biogenesis protein MshK